VALSGSFDKKLHRVGTLGENRGSLIDLLSPKGLSDPHAKG